MPRDLHHWYPDAGRCPSCNTPLTGAESPTDPERRMSPGDVTVCSYCGAVVEVEEGFSYRQMADHEVRGLNDPVLNALLVAIRGRGGAQHE